MILAVDIGNTNIAVGLYSLEGVCLMSFTVACDLKKSDSEYVILFRNLFDLEGFSLSGISGSIVGSVLPELTDTVCRAVRKLTGFAPLVVGPGMKTSLDIKTDRPGEVGADIVANAVAAIQKWTPPLAVLDFGTATTIVGINKQGQLTDVFILPGIRSSLEALTRDAAEIPSVPLYAPKSFSGKNTAASVNAGIVYANAFAADGFIDFFRKNYGTSTLNIVATGAMAELVLPFCRNRVDFCPRLTTDGLYRIYLKNCTN